MIQYAYKKDGKYHAHKVAVNGMTFDSKKEFRRYSELLTLENAGEIQNLQRQVKFVLIPAQYEESSEVYTRGEHKGEPKRGKLIERECAYYADFVYQQDGNTVVEDCKGMKTEVYKIKRKLMLDRYGVRIKET